jgi:hypothetical protein
MGGYPNFWPGWEADVLRAAGLPVTPANITFLANWHKYEGSAAANNPLNTTAYAPVPVTVGYKTLNSAGVQYYATQKQGAEATAAFLKMPNFSTIFAGLKSGDPYSYANQSTSKTHAIADELRTWGSKSFALVFAYEAPSPPEPGSTPTKQSTTNPETGKSTTSTTSAPDPLFGGLESWATNTGKLVLAYVLLVGVAGALLIVGLKGLGVPVPKVPKAMPVPVPVP